MCKKSAPSYHWLPFYSLKKDLMMMMIILLITIMSKGQMDVTIMFSMLENIYKKIISSFGLALECLQVSGSHQEKQICTLSGETAKCSVKAGPENRFSGHNSVKNHDI
jgi:hypothetical protein